MKHLRECDYSDAYLTLCKQSRVELEHPLLSQLHSTLVVRGDFVTTEAIVQQAAEGMEGVVCGRNIAHLNLCIDGYLDQYVSQQPVQAKWSPVKPTSGIIHGLTDVFIHLTALGRGEARDAWRSPDVYGC